MESIPMYVPVFWRFKGEKTWYWGFPNPAGASGLVHMGRYMNDFGHGPVVAPDEIEWRKA